MHPKELLLSISQYDHTQQHNVQSSCCEIQHTSFSLSSSDLSIFDLPPWKTPFFFLVSVAPHYLGFLSPAAAPRILHELCFCPSFTIRWPLWCPLGPLYSPSQSNLICSSGFKYCWTVTIKPLASAKTLFLGSRLM